MVLEEFSSNDLQEIIQQRGKAVLDRFNKEADCGITDPKLLLILQFVKQYWQDNYRSVLASFCCEAVGGCAKATDDLALMITLTSAGGGIHDDIIDRSVNKHFRYTVYGLHGLDRALLVGDLLIIKGWTMAHELARKTQPEKMSKILRIFGEWNADVCEAEFMELDCIRNLETELVHFERILRQSMADAQACAKLGVLMGDGTDNQVGALAEFGSDLGFLIRLANDLGDVVNVEGNLALRLENESVPLPILHTAKASRENYSKTKAILSKKRIDPLDISEILQMVSDSNSIGYVVDKAAENRDNAKQRLSELADSKAKTILSLLLDKAFSDILHTTNIS